MASHVATQSKHRESAVDRKTGLSAQAGAEISEALKPLLADVFRAVRED